MLQGKIGYLLKRPVGRPPQEVRRFFASFSYRAQSWNKPRHVVAKVEWHPGELYPRVGFIVTILARSAEETSHSLIPRTWGLKHCLRFRGSGHRVRSNPLETAVQTITFGLGSEVAT